MLDLQARVHLEEVEPARVDQVLHGADADVGHGTRRRHRRPPHVRTRGVGHQNRRGLLDDFLVPALHRALAVEEVEHGSVGVGDDLDLDVPGRLEVALQEHLVGAEGAGGLPASRRHGLVKILLAARRGACRALLPRPTP